MCRNHVCPHFCCSPEGKRQKRIMQRLGGISVDKLRKLPEPWRVGPSHGGSVAERAAYAQTITDSNELAELLELPESARVRIALASAPGLTAEQQSQVAEDEDARVRLALAKNPVTDEDVLKALAGDTDAKVQAAAKAALEARAADCPEGAGTLRTLSAERIAEMATKAEALDQRGRIDAARYTDDAALLAALAESGDTRVRTHVASNPNTPADVLSSLKDDPDHRIVREALQNPALSPEDLRRAAEEADNLEYVAQNPNAPADLLLEIATNPWHDVSALGAASAHPNTPVEGLRALAEHDDSRVKHGLAANPNTPADVLEALAVGAYPGGRAALAANPNTPGHVLQDLAQRDGSLHSILAANDSTPPELLDQFGIPGEEAKIRRGLVDVERLAKSILPEKRARVARATTDPQMHAYMLEDPSKDVRLSALRNPMTGNVDHMADDRAAEVRAIVAKKTTDPDVLAKLSQDDDEKVRDAVIANEATPAEVLYEMACYGDRMADHAAKAKYAARGELMPPLERKTRQAEEERQKRIDAAFAERSAQLASLRESTDTAHLASEWAKARVDMDQGVMRAIAHNPAAPAEARATALHEMSPREQAEAFDEALREGDRELYRYKFLSPKADVRLDALDLPDPEYLPEVAQMANSDRSKKVRERARHQLEQWAQYSGEVGEKARHALGHEDRQAAAAKEKVNQRAAALQSRIDRYETEIAELESTLARRAKREREQPTQWRSMDRMLREETELRKRLEVAQVKRRRAQWDLERIAGNSTERKVA